MSHPIPPLWSVLVADKSFHAYSNPTDVSMLLLGEIKPKPSLNPENHPTKLEEKENNFVTE